VTLSVLTTLQQWVLFTATTVSVGCVAWRWLIAARVHGLPGVGGVGLAALERRVATLGVATVVALAAGWVLRMVVQVMGFRDPFVPLWEDVSFLLFETFWGTVWMVQGALLPVLGVAFLRAQGMPGPRSVAWGVATFLALCLVSTLALSSHAMGVDAARPFFVAADAIHALGAGTWIGSLAVILTAGRAADRADEGRTLFAAQLKAFSPVAMVSVAGLLSMGAVLAWTHLDGLASLWTTSYGRTLSAKVGVALLVLAVGFRNWRIGLPAIGSADGESMVRRWATWEVSLATGVLLLTAVLVHMPKP
jgi:putative copper export protein